jgi:hypothetical protein
MRKIQTRGDIGLALAAIHEILKMMGKERAIIAEIKKWGEILRVGRSSREGSASREAAMPD